MWQEYVMQVLDAYVATGEYSFVQWQRMCNLSAKECIDRNYNFANGYSITTSGNIENWTVSPDPSDDGDFITLIAYKTWCNLYNSTIADRAANASMVKDGLSSIDTRNAVPRSTDAFKTPCEMFEELLEQNEGGSTVRISYNFALEDTNT